MKEKKEQQPIYFTEEEAQAIRLRADLRLRKQQLKVAGFNMEKTGAVERGLVKKRIESESSGEVEREYSQEDAQEMVPPLIATAQQSEFLPILSSSQYAQATKILELAGYEYVEYLEKAKQAADLARQNAPQISPSVLLPDATIIGIQTREIKKTPLPSHEKIAAATAENPKLLARYALVLPEDERQEFLEYLPISRRKEVSILLDTSVSNVLHSSIVEKKSDEGKQRAEVRRRVITELRRTIEEKNPNEKHIAAKLAEAMRLLGSDSQQPLLEIFRDEMEERQGKEAVHFSKDHLPRLVKVLIEEFDTDFRGNDLALHLAVDEKTPKLMAAYFLKKLVDNKYLESGVEEWYRAEGKDAKNKPRRLEIIRKLVKDLGVMPTKSVLEFVSDDSRWNKGEEVVSIEARVQKIKESQSRFEGIKDNRELVSALRQDENTAMTYFLLNGGNDRFNLINNYDFTKFWEILGLIDDLEVHEKPLRNFANALEESGKSKSESDEIIDKLKEGHYPYKPGQESTVVSFEVSENAALKNANAEIANVMGSKQLGVILRSPLYRQYLSEQNSDQSRKLLESLETATTFADRGRVLDMIEKANPDFSERLKKDLGDNWLQMGEKMVMELSLETVLNEESVPIKGEELIPRLDSKRVDLKRIKKETLVALKGENKQVIDLQKKIYQKKKALSGLRQGLEHQTNEDAKKKLEEKIEKGEREIREMEELRTQLGQQFVDQRYAGLSESEKKEEMDNVSKEIIALTEKDPSAIFTYIIMQVIEESALKESDLNLIKEMESHLQGPFQTIKDLATYERPKEKKSNQRITLRFLDKAERLMTMVRFADSKICCFSSSNYEMRVQHDTPNKFWVASINADPMSFVMSMELPQEGTSQVHENIGFIFGNYAVDDQGKLGILLNGIYYAPGIEGQEQLEVIMHGVEDIFKGSGAKTLSLASQHGGSVRGMPQGYSNQDLEMIRLRALDSGDGTPEDKIYDDLSTGSDLNKKHIYGGHVWHKRVNL